MSAMNEPTNGAALLVRAPGLMTTVQDLGRPGHGRYGVSIGGALDEGALRWANLLVDNPPEAAALEITLLGPTLTVAGDRPIVAALTGADCAATLNGTPVAPWRSFRCDPGDTLTLGGCTLGARAYLALGGGIAVPLALGSRSTDLIGRLGGVEGRALRAGDRVPLDPPAELPPLYAVPPREIPQYGEEYTARVILGPQDERITPESLTAFLSAPYTVGHESDRMGARLSGPPLAFRADSPGADILSEGIATGAIQVPAGGQPIVLLAGHQTTGGYAKIATVIAVDLWQLGQARPGDTVSFRAVTITEAREALRQSRAASDPGALVSLMTGKTPMSDQQSATTMNLEGGETFAAELSAAEHTDWHPAAIEALLTRAAATDVRTLTLETPGFRLHLRRGGADATATDSATATTVMESGATPPPPDLSGATITAPVLGIFYRAAKPDQPPLVEVGTRIEAGQVVGLIEVMKTFHEVTAETSGRITAALVENGASVQYGQTLFTISREGLD